MQPTQLANEMLNKITDPVERERYGNILNGQVSAVVHCNSKTCKGRVIADIMADNSCQETEPLTPTDEMVAKAEKQNAKTAKYNEKHPDEPKEFVVLPQYISGLEGDRIRLDGSRGFRCYCGNSSILHEHEQGHVGANAPSKRELEKVFGKMLMNPSEYPEVNGKMIVDGFTIERVQV